MDKRVLSVLQELRSKNKESYCQEELGSYVESDPKAAKDFYDLFNSYVIELESVLGDAVYIGPGGNCGYSGPMPANTSISCNRANEFVWWENSNEQVVLILSSHDAGTLLNITIEVTQIPQDLLLTEQGYEERKNLILEAQELQKTKGQELMAKKDKRFWSLLGEETGPKKCKNEYCARKQIHQSVFCKIHHFEKYYRSPCPFS